MAERYLDKAVSPRPLTLRASGATPGAPLVAADVDTPVNTLGGYRRFQRILDGLSSADPAVAADMAKSADVARLRCPDVCGDDDFETEFARLGL